jgi:hypothetical protein
MELDFLNELIDSGIWRGGSYQALFTPKLSRECVSMRYDFFVKKNQVCPHGFCSLDVNSNEFDHCPGIRFNGRLFFPQNATFFLALFFASRVSYWVFLWCILFFLSRSTQMRSFFPLQSNQMARNVGGRNQEYASKSINWPNTSQ